MGLGNPNVLLTDRAKVVVAKLGEHNPKIFLVKWSFTNKIT